MRWVATAFALSGVFYLLMFLASGPYQAMVFMAIAGTVGATTNGPVFSAIQGLVPERMRAVALAMVFLLANFIGLGLGPLAVGALVMV